MESGKLEHPVIAEDTGVGRLQVEICTQGSSFNVDEPVSAGGLASGPSPFDLLSASLGACTVMTIKFYAKRKAILVTRVQVIVFHRRDRDSGRDIFHRSIFIAGPTDEEQVRQLLVVAGHCPVSKTLSSGADIETQRNSSPILTGRRLEDDQHVHAMKVACDAIVDAAC